MTLKWHTTDTSFLVGFHLKRPGGKGEGGSAISCLTLFFAKNERIWRKIQDRGRVVIFCPKFKYVLYGSPFTQKYASIVEFWCLKLIIYSWHFWEKKLKKHHFIIRKRSKNTFLRVSKFFSGTSFLRTQIFSSKSCLLLKGSHLWNKSHGEHHFSNDKHPKNPFFMAKIIFIGDIPFADPKIFLAKSCLLL